MNISWLYWWSVNIGSGNGLVPSGNKPLPEPILTQISDTIWRHWQWVNLIMLGLFQCYVTLVAADIHYLLFVAEWQHMASYIFVNNGLDNGLSPARYQAIAWTKTKLFSIGPLGTSVKFHYHDFIQEDAFENIVCKIVVILFWLYWVNSYWSKNTYIHH